MNRRGLESLLAWLLAFAFFGPWLALKLTESLDSVVAQMTPYVSVLGVAAVVLLLARNLH